MAPEMVIHVWSDARRAVASARIAGTASASSRTFTGRLSRRTWSPFTMVRAKASVIGTFLRSRGLPSLPSQVRSTDRSCSTKRGRQPSRAKGMVRWYCAPVIWAIAA